MPQDKMVTWAIVNFPEKVKNKFLGLAKMQGKHTATLLANLLRRWFYEVEKDNRKGK